MPDAEPFSWSTVVGGGALFVGTVCYAWWKSWLEGRKEGRDIVQPKHVILEQAELADLAAIKTMAAKIDSVYSEVQEIGDNFKSALRRVEEVESRNRDRRNKVFSTLESNHGMLKELVVGMRALILEVERSKAVREDRARRKAADEDD